MRRLFTVSIAIISALSLTACGAARTKREKAVLLSLADTEVCYKFSNPKDAFEKEAARQLIEEKGLWKNEDCVTQYIASASNAALCSDWAFGTRNQKYIATEIANRGLTGQNCAELIAAKQAAEAQAAQASQNFYRGLTGLGMSMMQQGANNPTYQKPGSAFHSYTINGRVYNCSTMGTITNCRGN